MSETNAGGSEEIVLVVGLDIGTTFSGVAFQLQKDGREMSELHEVRNWPSPSGHAREADQVKVPTKVDYEKQHSHEEKTGDDSGDEDGDDRPLWGYLVVNESKTSVEGAKMLLVDKASLPAHLRDSAWLNKSRKKVKELGKTPVQVLADYIRQLWKHAVGDDKTKGYIDRYLLPPLKAFTMKTHVVVTIPAIWKNEALQGMKNALSASILRNNPNITFEFLSEPEAALMAYAKKIRNQLQVGDIITCLDLGGGTADCISYRLRSSDPMAWGEVVPGDGDLCGAMFLDEAYKALLERTLRSDGLSVTPEGMEALLRNEWEHAIKRDFEFSNSIGKPRTIRLSAVTNHVRSITLLDPQLKRVFDSVTTPVLGLVQRQSDEVKKANGGKASKAILVVGGFGRCPYIRGALEDKFGGGVGSGNDRASGPKTKRARTGATAGASSGVPIMTDVGDMPWLATCHGAVQSKRRDNARVESRKARFNFGFPQNNFARPEEGGKWDDLFGRPMIPNTMTWVLKRGDDIKASNKILQQSLAFPGSQTEQKLYHRSTFYANKDETPPTRFHPRRVGEDEEFQDRGSIEIHVPVSLKELPLCKDKTGGESRVFDYDLHINSKGESIHVEAFATETGEKVGKLQVGLKNLT